MKSKIIFTLIFFLLAGNFAGAQEKPDAVKLYKEKKYQQAIEICKNEIKDMPANRDSYVVIGWCFIALGQFDEAFAYTKTGIEKSGISASLLTNAEDSLTQLYEQLYNLGKYDEALQRIRQFIAYLPNSAKIAQAYALMGDIYINKGSYIYADLALSYALSISPSVFEWWVSAGNAREKFGDNKSALAAYEKALKLNPNHQDALRGRDRMREKLSP